MTPTTRRSGIRRPPAGVVLAVALMFVTACDTASSSGPDADQPLPPAEEASTSTTAGTTSTVSDQEPPATDPPLAPDPSEQEEPVVDDGRTRIVVDSTTDEYFVLYVRPNLEADREIPVAVILGEEGSTVITDGRGQLPDEHYRIESRPTADPADVDRDGIDDLTELSDPEANPLNPAEQSSFDQGTVIIVDREMFETLSYQGQNVGRDDYLAGLEYVKFYMVGADGPNPTLYFMNTETFRAHPRFAEAIGLDGGRGPRPGVLRGDIVYNPEGVAPDGSIGTYRFAFQPNDAYPFEDIALAFEMLSSGMPFLDDNLLYEPYPSAALPLYEREKDLYDAYRIPILLN